MYTTEGVLSSVLDHMATADPLYAPPPVDVHVNLSGGVLRLSARYASTHTGVKLSALTIRFCDVPGSLSTFVVHYDFQGSPHGVITASGPGGTGYKHRVSAASQAMAFPPRFPERKRDTFALLNRLVFQTFVI